MFTEFDVAVAIILLIVTIASMIRGVIKEILSLIALGGTAILTLYFYPLAHSFTHPHFTSATVGSIMAIVVLFLIALILCAGLAFIVNTSFGESRGGTLDRLGGAFFGFIKGYCIVSLIHFIIFFAVGREDPDWLQSGETYALTQTGAQFLDNQLKDYILTAYENIQETQDENNSSLSEFIDENGEPALDAADDVINDIVP